MFKLNKESDNPIVNQKSKVENPQSGIVLVTVMIMITLLIVVGITMNRESGIRISALPKQLKKQEAIYIAEAGIQHTLYELMKDPIKRGNIFTNKQFSKGVYSTEAWQPQGALGDIIIKSTGEVREGSTLIAQKTIQTRIKSRGNVLVFRSEAADTYIEKSNPSRNHGGETKLLIGKNSSSNYYRALMKFDLSNIPQGYDLVNDLGAYKAYIALYMDDYAGSGMPIIDIHRVTRSWKEGTGTDGGGGSPDGATWNTYDGVNPWNTPGGDQDIKVESFTIIKEERKILYKWDLPDLSLIQGWVDDPNSNFGIIMKDSTEDKWVVADAVKFRYLCSNPIVDDRDSGFSYIGTWTRAYSSSAYGSGGWGGNSYYYNNTPGDGDTATWKASLCYYAGAYNVYIWYPNSSFFAMDAKFTINTATGSTTKGVNQGVNGGQWVAIGKYTFANNGLENVTLSDNFTPFKVAGDAVRYQPTNVEIIVDDKDTGFSYIGTWPQASSSSAYGSGGMGGKYYRYHNPGTSTETATWTANLPCGAGSYNIYVWYPKSSSFATDAQFTVSGFSPVTVNQSTGGGTWYSIGTYSLGATATVTLIDSTTGKVAADAVRFVPTFETDGIVDNTNSGFSVTGTWGTSIGSGNYGADYRDHEAGTGTNIATWNSNLRCGAGSYNVDIWYPSSSYLARDARYTIYYNGGSSSTKTVNQSVNGGKWVSVGTYTFKTTGTEKVTLSDYFTPARVAADAVKFEPAFTAELVVDNNNTCGSPPCFKINTGTWKRSSSSSDWDPYFHYNEPGTGPGIVTWNPDLSLIFGPGRYEVFVWYPKSSGFTPPGFTTGAPYTVYYTSGGMRGGSGSSIVLVDQSINGGLWVNIGTYNLDNNSKVTLDVGDLYGIFISSESGSSNINLWPMLVIMY
ncbi:MAG: DNRLRE domain-containing protein [Nitrospinae bacterium]|nr:DNRLRE domain-containing protein [Nitrospinota bacterium]